MEIDRCIYGRAAFGIKLLCFFKECHIIPELKGQEFYLLCRKSL
jgi:hypothetical protein